MVASLWEILEAYLGRHIPHFRTQKSKDSMEKKHKAKINHYLRREIRLKINAKNAKNPLSVRYVTRRGVPLGHKGLTTHLCRRPF